MWLASLKDGDEVIAQARNLVDLYEVLNEKELADGTEIAVIWTGKGAPIELLEML